MSYTILVTVDPPLTQVDRSLVLSKGKEAVPTSRIKILCGSEATRGAIICEITTLH